MVTKRETLIFLAITTSLANPAYRWQYPRWPQTCWFSVLRIQLKDWTMQERQGTQGITAASQLRKKCTCGNRSWWVQMPGILQKQRTDPFCSVQITTVIIHTYSHKDSKHQCFRTSKIDRLATRRPRQIIIHSGFQTLSLYKSQPTKTITLEQWLRHIQMPLQRWTIRPTMSIVWINRQRGHRAWANKK